MKIGIIGGSGLIRKKLTSILLVAGDEAPSPLPVNRRRHPHRSRPLWAFRGAHTVVDVSNSLSFEETAVLKFFETSARNVADAEKTAGVQHHVALSVVGAHRLASGGYMRAKVAQEKIIRSSGVPFSIVRATQFFEFMGGIADASTQDGTVLLPQASMQPMAADDVASELAKIVTGPPVHDIVEIAGPEKLPIADFVQRALAAKHDKRKVVAGPQGLYFGYRLEDNSLTPGSANPRLGATRFEGWLETDAN